MSVQAQRHERNKAVMLILIVYDPVSMTFMPRQSYERHNWAHCSGAAYTAVEQHTDKPLC